MKHLFLFALTGFLLIPVVHANNGRYQRGNAVYKEKLSECALWWHRFGDITQSKGKRIDSGDLALELGKLKDHEIRQWLADPLSIGPKVNCHVGRFTTERQVQDLIHYLQRRATNPVVVPEITRIPVRRTEIRLLRSHAIIRERMRVREEIRQMNQNPNRPRGGTTPQLRTAPAPVEGNR